jgi:hypothetical protein
VRGGVSFPATISPCSVIPATAEAALAPLHHQAKQAGTSSPKGPWLSPSAAQQVGNLSASPSPSRACSPPVLTVAPAPSCHRKLLAPPHQSGSPSAAWESKETEERQGLDEGSWNSWYEGGAKANSARATLAQE